MTTRVHSLNLERFLLGEMPEADRAALEKALAAEPDLRRALDELRGSNQEIAERYRTSVVGGAIRARFANRRPSARRSPGHHLVLAGALATAMVLIGFGLKALDPGARPSNPLETETVQTKGASSTLRVFRKTATGSEPLGSGSRAAKGDLVRLGYQTARARYGLIVSVDGRNNMTRHWPRDGDRAGLMRASGLTLLDEAFELDDAPRFERFYLVTGDHAFATEGVIAALRDMENTAGLRDASLPAGLELTTVELHKEPSR